MSQVPDSESTNNSSLSFDADKQDPISILIKNLYSKSNLFIDESLKSPDGSPLHVKIVLNDLIGMSYYWNGNGFSEVLDFDSTGEENYRGIDQTIAQNMTRGSFIESLVRTFHSEPTWDDDIYGLDEKDSKYDLNQRRIVMMHGLLNLYRDSYTISVHYDQKEELRQNVINFLKAVGQSNPGLEVKE